MVVEDRTALPTLREREIPPSSGSDFLPLAHDAVAIERLQRREEEFHSVVETASDAIISVDARGLVGLWNQASQNIFGYTAAEMIGQSLSRIMPERFRADHQRGIHRLLESGEPRVIGKTFETVGLRKGGSEFPIELSLASWTVRNETYFTGIIRDISKRKEAERKQKESEQKYRQLFVEMKELAQKDPLTNLWNHRRITEQIEYEIERSSRGSHLFSIMMMDVDSFKPINDTYGHLVGDDVLLRVARTLEKQSRSVDSIGRYGGDEFLVILPYTNGEQAKNLAVSFSNVLQENGLQVDQDTPIPIRLSIGVATNPFDGSTAKDLISKADERMYRSKLSSRQVVATSVAEVCHYFNEEDPTLPVIHGLVEAVNAKDYYTKAHSDLVAKLSVALGKKIGLSTKQLDSLRTAGLLHDIGKIGIPDTILRKPGNLKIEEYEIIKQHPRLGVIMLNNATSQSKQTVDAILYHHERFDGSGYPRGLVGKAIPYLARIIAIADSYSAMVTDRPYRNAIGQDEALQYLNQQAGHLFDPELIPLFADCVRSSSCFPSE